MGSSRGGGQGSRRIRRVAAVLASVVLASLALAQEPSGGTQGSPPLDPTQGREPTPPPPAGDPGAGPPPAPRGAGDTVPEGAAEESEAPLPIAPELPAFEPVYRPYEEVARLTGELARRAAGVARDLELPGGLDGRPLPAIEFGRPGPVPLEQRPTVVLVGGLDGVSLSGGEAVLACVHWLLEQPERLPPDVAFVAVPWGAPRGLQRARSPLEPPDREERALDEDADGQFDEDPPDDIDGDGLVLSMLIEDPVGPWTFSRDQRLLARAAAGDGPRYRLAPEGRDDDGDGRFNEDGPGGVVPDRNFPLGREEAWRDPGTGTLPLSEPAARGLADLALGRRTAAVVLLQGNHGGLATPGGAPGPDGVALPLEADRRLYERATESFLALSGRRQPGLQTLREARGRTVCGAALDWFYAGVGAFAMEIAPWGPTVEGGADVAARDARFQGPVEANRDLGARPEPDERDRAWARWLDNTRGGLGFVDWYPVDLDGGAQALVGGWEQRTILDPPPESLPRALAGLPEFVAALASGLPRLEVRLHAADRDGEVVQLRASVRNLGVIPTGLAGAGGPGSPGALTLELVLPAGARLLAGEARVPLGRLDGGEVSREVAWLLLAPQSCTFRVRAEAELALPVDVTSRP